MSGQLMPSVEGTGRVLAYQELYRGVVLDVDARIGCPVVVWRSPVARFVDAALEDAEEAVDRLCHEQRAIAGGAS